jgi:hypothetical protein
LEKEAITHMLYAILCYDREDVIGSWTKEEHEGTMARLKTVREELTREGKLGPVARLLPTTSAATLRKGKEALVIDGPFAETKEQLLGFYIVNCASLDEALDIARRLAYANSLARGSYEVRPLSYFDAGGGAEAGAT